MNPVRKDTPSEASASEIPPPRNSTLPLLQGLGGMLLLMCTGMGIGIYQLHDMAAILDNVVREDEMARDAIYTMHRVTRNRALIMSEAIATKDHFERDEKLLEFDRLARGFGTAMQRQAELSVTPEEKAVLARQRELISDLLGFFDRIVDLAHQNELAIAASLFQSGAIPAQSEMLDTLMHWAEIHHKQHSKLVKDAQTQQVISMMFGVAMISILVGLLVAGVVYRWNGRLIGRFVENEGRLRAALAELDFRQQAMDAHSIVSVADVAGAILHVNDKFCEVSGYRRDELIGQNHRIVKSDFHPPEFFQDMWETISSGRVWTGEVKNRAKDGPPYWVQTTIVPMLDASGLPLRYISVRTEITHIKEMEASVREANVILKSNVLERTHELEQAKMHLEQELGDRVRTQDALQKSYDELKSLHRQLQEAQQYLMQSEKLAAVGQLAAGMAHEINNPIGFIASNLATLGRYQDTLGAVLERYIQQESGLDEDARTAMVAFRQQADLEFLLKDTQDLLAESRSGIERVRNIVRDLRDFARVDSDGQWQRVDINHCLDTTLNLLGERFAEGVSVQREYGGAALVECNPADLNQVFVNLLNNAQQALQGKPGSIILRSGVEGEQAWVEIEDTGEGIPESILPRIFNPFYTTRSVGQGAGLGLSTAYGVVQQHGGKITVSSRVGVGSVFKVTLPIGHDVVAINENHEQEAMAVASSS